MISGSEALAYGALAARVQFVTGYPGSPSTATVEALLRLTHADSALAGAGWVRIEWAINEKSAFDAALGASLAGARAMVCLKSVGLNVALDGLMVANLAPGEGGLVILVGDDPSGWGSQNEEDARPLVAAAEVPLLEPSTVPEAQALMRQAFELSERVQVPVAVRVTRALTVDRRVAPPVEIAPPGAKRPGRFERRADRYNVLPIHVVTFHERLQAKVRRVRFEFEDWPWNGETGTGRQGIIAGGQVAHKLSQVLAQNDPPSLRILHLSTLYPLPEARIGSFLGQLDQVLVLEEVAPYLETQVQAIAQRAGLVLPILGRATGHLPGAGELFAPEIGAALAGLVPNWLRPAPDEADRTMPSRQPLCDDCSYIPTLEALYAVMEQHGGRDAFVVTGETGCIVRAQLPPWKLLDVKYAMGSSIGLAAGLARAAIPQRIVAISGDSAFLHSGIGELIDAAQAGIRLLVVILANETTALSGGQPHPATNYDAQGRPRPGLDLATLVRAAGANSVCVVDPLDRRVTEAAFEEGLASSGLAVVISQRACPKWDREATL